MYNQKVQWGVEVNKKAQDDCEEIEISRKEPKDADRG